MSSKLLSAMWVILNNQPTRRQTTSGINTKKSEVCNYVNLIQCAEAHTSKQKYAVNNLNRLKKM